MVRDDVPVTVDLSEQERIDSSDVSDLPFDQPFPDDEVMIRGYALDLQESEEELSHFVRGIITLFIIGQCSLIAVCNTGCADEHEGVIVPIAFHEIIDAAAVPGGCLVCHQHADGGFVGRPGWG